ncbi:hypothetical protein KIL84_005997, partial [Mauremys mutica]
MKTPLLFCLLSALLETGEIKSPAVFKSCVSSSQCRLSPLSMTFGNGISVTTIIACCVGRACKTASVT